MSDVDPINSVQDPEQSDKVSRKKMLETGGKLAAAGLAAPMLAGLSAAEMIEAAGGLPYVAHTNVKGSITFWHFWFSTVRHGAIQQIIADFNKFYPGIQVNEQPVPFGQIYTKELAVVASGQGVPDVIIEDRPQLRTRAHNRIDESIASLVRRDRVSGSIFWPFTWREADVNGQAYGLPYETDVRVLYYNKTALKDAGLNPSRAPQNWTELEQYANKIDAKSNNSGMLQRIAFFPTFGNIGLDTWAWNNGGEWQKSDYTPTLNAPANVAALAWMANWAKRYGGMSRVNALAATFGNAVDVADAFLSGKVVMIVDIQGYQRFINLAQTGGKLNFEVGVSHIPPAPGHRPASYSGGFAVSMPRNNSRTAANRAAAWEFMKYLSLVGQQQWAHLTYGMPTVVRVAKTDPALNASPHWKEFVADMGYGRPGTYNPYYPSMLGDLLGPATNAALQGNLTPAQALIRAQQEALTEINRAKKTGQHT